MKLKTTHWKKIAGVAALIFFVFAPFVPAFKIDPAISSPIRSVVVQKNTEGGFVFHITMNVNTVLASSTATCPDGGPPNADGSCDVGTPSTPAASNSAPTPQTPNLLSTATTAGVYLAALVANGIITLALTLAEFFVRIGLQMNDNIFNAPFIQIGFSVSLAIANLGFVLGIIIIALATIIRNSTYGIKQLLWKLVVMAILVNFGLVIAAPIVGTADSMTSYFINAMSPSAAQGGYEGFVATLSAGFSPQTTLGPQTTAGTAASAACSAVPFFSGTCNALASGINLGAAASTGDVFWQSVMAIIFAVFLNLLIFITISLLAILLIVRYLMLGGLMVVLPLAWLTWIFPKFSNNFGKWWNEFVRWTLFPPLALFFIYLAFQTASMTSPTAQTYLQQAAQIPPGSTSGVEASIGKQTGTVPPIQQAANEVILGGLTLMGLFFALSLTGKAGTMVVDGAKSTSKVVGGYVGKQGKRLAGDRIRTAGKKYNEETRETTSWLQRQGSKLQGVPVLRGAGAAVANYAAPKAVHEERKEDVKKYISENLANLTNDGLKKRATSRTAFANPTTAAAIAQELARRDMIGDLDEKTRDKYIDYAEKMGTADAIYNNRPDLMQPRMIAAEPATGTSPAVAARMETKEEAVARVVKATNGDVINVNAQVFNAADPTAAAAKLGTHVNASILNEAILALSPSQLGTLGNDPGSTERKTNITTAIRKLINPYRKEIEKKEDELDTAGKKTGKVLIIKTGKYELDAKSLPTNLKNLEKLVKHMENNPNWESALGN